MTRSAASCPASSCSLVPPSRLLKNHVWHTRNPLRRKEKLNKSDSKGFFLFFYESGCILLMCGKSCSRRLLHGSFKTVYFSKTRIESAKIKISFASMSVEMCPVRLCLSILPDASGIIEAGSWRNPIRGAWRHSALFVTRHAGFRSGSCGLGGLDQVAGISPAHGTGMGRFPMPQSGHGGHAAAPTGSSPSPFSLRRRARERRNSRASLDRSIQERLVFLRPRFFRSSFPHGFRNHDTGEVPP